MSKSKTTGNEVLPNGTAASYQRKMRDIRLGKPNAPQPTPADRKAWREYYRDLRARRKAEAEKAERAAKRAAKKAEREAAAK